MGSIQIDIKEIENQLYDMRMDIERNERFIEGEKRDIIMEAIKNLEEEMSFLRDAIVEAPDKEEIIENETDKWLLEIHAHQS